MMSYLSTLNRTIKSEQGVKYMHSQQSANDAAYDEVFIVVLDHVTPDDLPGFYDVEGPFTSERKEEHTYIGKLLRRHRSTLEARDDIIGIYPNSKFSTFSPENPRCACETCSCNPCTCG